MTAVPIRRSRTVSSTSVGRSFDLGQVAVGCCQFPRQVSVDPASFGCSHWRGAIVEMVIEANQMSQHLVANPGRGSDLGEAEIMLTLKAVEFDLELGPTIGRLGVEQRLHPHPQSFGQETDGGQTWFPLAVLDQGEIGGRLSDLGPELVEGKTGSATEMTHPLSQGDQVNLGRHERKIIKCYRLGK